MSNEYVRYDRLNPIGQTRVKTLIMAASSAPIFISTSQGLINLCAVERIAPRTTNKAVDDTELTLIIHLFSGVHIHLDCPEECDRLLEIVPVWCDLQTSVGETLTSFFRRFQPALFKPHRTRAEQQDEGMDSFGGLVKQPFSTHNHG